mgnify:CR=1 FL=1
MSTLWNPRQGRRRGGSGSSGRGRTVEAYQNIIAPLSALPEARSHRPRASGRCSRVLKNTLLCDPWMDRQIARLEKVSNL